MKTLLVFTKRYVMDSFSLHLSIPTYPLAHLIIPFLLFYPPRLLLSVYMHLLSIDTPFIHRYPLYPYIPLLSIDTFLSSSAFSRPTYPPFSTITLPRLTLIPLPIPTTPSLIPSSTLILFYPLLSPAPYLSSL